MDGQHQRVVFLHWRPLKHATIHRGMNKDRTLVMKNLEKRVMANKPQSHDRQTVDSCMVKLYLQLLNIPKALVNVS